MKDVFFSKEIVFLAFLTAQDPILWFPMFHRKRLFAQQVICYLENKRRLA